jgi:hypothetical protein
MIGTQTRESLNTPFPSALIRQRPHELQRECKRAGF